MDRKNHNKTEGGRTHPRLPVRLSSDDTSAGKSRQGAKKKGDRSEYGTMDSQELEDGLAALKQRDYPTAIARLERACELELDNPTLYKAQVALVRAYEGNNEIHKAALLCHLLTESKNAKVKTWAVRTLGELESRHPNCLAEAQEAEEEAARRKPFGYEDNIFLWQAVKLFLPIFRKLSENPRFKAWAERTIAEFSEGNPNALSDAQKAAKTARRKVATAQRKAERVSVSLAQKAMGWWEDFRKIIERAWERFNNRGNKTRR